MRFKNPRSVGVIIFLIVLSVATLLYFEFNEQNLESELEVCRELNASTNPLKPSSTAKQCFFEFNERHPDHKYLEKQYQKWW